MIPSIITPMRFTLVRDAICELLASERDNQITLLKEQGFSDFEISQKFDFTVYPKRYRFPDIDEMPCVFMYFTDMEFPTDEQDIFDNYAVAKFQVEYYTAGENEEDGINLFKTADESADDRLNYLTAQIYKTLCSEETNVYKGTQNLVKSFTLKRWKRTQTPDEANEARTILGGLFEFEVGFDEPTYYTNTIDVEEFYKTLRVRDEFISPYVRQILKVK